MRTMKTLTYLIKIIFNFSDYCFFRIATSKTIPSLDGKEPRHYHMAHGAGICGLYNMWTIINICYIFCDSMCGFLFVYIAALVLYIIIGLIKTLTEKPTYLFDLSKKCANEKHKKLKGWGVFLYVIGSLFIYFYTLAILFSDPFAKIYLKELLCK